MTNLLKRFAPKRAATLLATLMLAVLPIAAATSASAATEPSPSRQVVEKPIGAADVCNYTSSRPTLRKGSSGAAVRQAQCYLNNSLSPYVLSPRLAEDGSFGPLTHSATLTFQTCAGIRVDGVIGPQTWGALQYWANNPTHYVC